MVDRPAPVTNNTKFAIASLSKAFTATLIGILLKEQETRSVSAYSRLLSVAVGRVGIKKRNCR